MTMLSWLVAGIGIAVTTAFAITRHKREHERIIRNLLDTHKAFFDRCLNYPLDEQQRRSIVSEADNCLVVSSAGSGKSCPSRKMYGRERYRSLRSAFGSFFLTSM